MLAIVTCFAVRLCGLRAVVAAVPRAGDAG
jgi:hypothetical protein